VNVLTKPRFTYTVATDNGTAGSGIASSVSDAIVRGHNYARFLLRPDSGRKSCTVTVEVVCTTCEGEGKVVYGKRSLRSCPDCKGGRITSPISGPTAISFTVMMGGALDGESSRPCDCGENRAGLPGEICRKCSHAVREPSP
jgi:hypothetical protein